MQDVTFQKEGNSSVRNLLHNDLKQGTKRNITVFAVAFLFAVVCSGFLYKMVQGKIMQGKLSEYPGVYDFCVYLFGGMKKYTESAEREFKMPMIWLAVQFLVSCCVFLYPVKDLQQRGSMVLLLYGSKRNWWISKCIWTVVQVILLYAVLIAGVVFSTLLFGNKEGMYSNEITAQLYGVRFITTQHLGFLIVCIPLMHSIMAAVSQVNIGLIISPVYSVLIVTAYQVLSAYITSPFLLANYSMALRQDILVGDGVSFMAGILIEIVLSVLMPVIGLMCFRKKDIL